ncbi:hypothetical protein C8R43DRAFT_1197079 [Mycena crocata]|nr:hypothetical protein C8R43DRAFT_1197079 [Mycena crocata]
MATVSPARSNMEETLSIRNKPQLNQRMTCNSLLKESVAEIERLKADVPTAREKNGIFFSEETWVQLSAEQEMCQTELEEAKKQVEIVEMCTVHEEFLKFSSQSTLKLHTEAKQFEAKELEALAGHSERVDQQLKHIHAALAVVHAKDMAEAEALTIATCNEVNVAGIEAFTTVEKAVKAMRSVENIVREACTFVEAERDLVVEAKLLAANATASEMTRLRNQNDLLVQLLDDEKLKGEEAKDELLQRVSGMLGDFMRERDQGLREAVGIVQAEEGMKVFNRKHGDIVETMETKSNEVEREVEKWGRDAKRARDGVLKHSTAKLMRNEPGSDWR